jgi:hypothetical protein
MGRFNTFNSTFSSLPQKYGNKTLDFLHNHEISYISNENEIICGKTEPDHTLDVLIKVFGSN